MVRDACALGVMTMFAVVTAFDRGVAVWMTLVCISVFVPPNAAGLLLETMRAHPLGREAQVIGEVTATHPGRVHLRTRIGGSRILDMLVGDQLPRIC